MEIESQYSYHYDVVHKVDYKREELWRADYEALVGTWKGNK